MRSRSGLVPAVLAATVSIAPLYGQEPPHAAPASARLGQVRFPVSCGAARQPEFERARSLVGAARAAELAGDASGARRWYRRYLEVTATGDGTRAELAAARRAVAR